LKPESGKKRIIPNETQKNLQQLAQIPPATGHQSVQMTNRWGKAGSYQEVWNANGIGAGIYLVKLETPSFSATKKVTLVK